MERLDAGFQRAGQPVKRGTMAHDHDVYMLLTDTAAEARDAVALAEHTPRLAELATRDSHSLYLAIAQRARGILDRLAGDYQNAQMNLTQALELFERLGTRWQRARTLAELGELEMMRNDAGQAREYFSQALEEFETLGALPDLRRTQELMDR